MPPDAARSSRPKRFEALRGPAAWARPWLLRHYFDGAGRGIVINFHPVRRSRNFRDVFFLHEFVQVLGEMAFVDLKLLNGRLQGRQVGSGGGVSLRLRHRSDV